MSDMGGLGIPELLIIFLIVFALLGGVALVITMLVMGPIVLLSKLSSRNAAQGPSAKKCPFCAATIQAEAIVCRFCGRDLHIAARGLTSTEPPV